jgi:hypothetical protein
LKGFKAAYIMSALGIFLFLSVMIPGRSIFEKTETLNGSVSMQKITVSVKNHLDPIGSSLLSLKDMDGIREAMDGRLISHTMQDTLPISFERISVNARVIGTDSFYSMFHEVRIKSGGFLTQESEQRGETVAVIEDALAWQLFNTDNAVGNQISIFGRTFRIIGVSYKDSSIISKVSDDGNANIYIPSKTFSDLDANAGISHFEVATSDNNTLGRNESEITEVIQSIGKNPTAYKITDYNIESALMEQKPFIAIFVMGFNIIIWTLFYIKTIILNLISFFKSQSSTDYFSGIVRHNTLFMLQTASKTALAILFILGLWKCIRFRLYINPALVPDELIDISYYINFLEEHLRQSALNTGFIASYAEQLFIHAKGLSDVIFFTGFIPGLLLLSTGLSLFQRNTLEADRILLTVGIMLLLSTGILQLLSITYELQAVIDMKSFAVLCSFLTASCLRNKYIKPGRLENIVQIGCIHR